MSNEGHLYDLIVTPNYRKAYGWLLATGAALIGVGVVFAALAGKPVNFPLNPGSPARSPVWRSVATLVRSTWMMWGIHILGSHLPGVNRLSGNVGFMGGMANLDTGSE